ncbi:probable serine carboxypeptidase CPVL isoform X2 [Ornithodoros turicata]|uniref:probable serine carboxypeptidase CPVL isoform X2 n=1 Tax=Ornithodoros turicata TaxID=34597 RepID=UPI0031390810
MDRTAMWVLLFLVLAGQTLGQKGHRTQCTKRHVKKTQTPDEGSQPLFLSQYIGSKRLAEGIRKSKVELLSETGGPLTAYSGYITIQKNHFSNLFFLLIEAQNQPETAPLVLWLQGGPGTSSLFGQFLENGPVGINRDGELFKREHTLQKECNVLYLDQPVGAGYSFTKSEAGYSRSLKDITKDLRQFLKAFLKLFPKYNERELYIAGESYGVRPAIALAHDLHKRSTKTSDPEESTKGSRDLNMNLRGVVCGVGLYSPLLDQVDITKYFYHMGLLDHNSYNYVTKVINDAAQLINSDIPTLRLVALKKLVDLLPVLEMFTGISYDGNILQANEPHEQKQFKAKALTEKFKRGFHVGLNATFSVSPVRAHLAEDFFFDISTMLIELLNSDYKFLVYVGQLDRTFAPASTERIFKNLKWKHIDAFRTALRSFWHLDDEDEGSSFAGYMWDIYNLKYVLMTGVGHYPGFDRPQAFYQLMRKFIFGKEFSTKQPFAELLTPAENGASAEGGRPADPTDVDNVPREL